VQVPPFSHGFDLQSSISENILAESSLEEHKK